MPGREGTAQAEVQRLEQMWREREPQAVQHERWAASFGKEPRALLWTGLLSQLLSLPRLTVMIISLNVLLSRQAARRGTGEPPESENSSHEAGDRGLTWCESGPYRCLSPSGDPEHCGFQDTSQGPPGP